MKLLTVQSECQHWVESPSQTSSENQQYSYIKQSKRKLTLVRGNKEGLFCLLIYIFSRHARLNKSEAGLYRVAHTQLKQTNKMKLFNYSIIPMKILTL